MRHKAEIENQFNRTDANPNQPIRDGNEAYQEAFRQGIRMALGWVLYPDAFTQPPTKMLAQIRKVRTGM